jgi:hypothetical protein
MRRAPSLSASVAALLLLCLPVSAAEETNPGAASVEKPHAGGEAREGSAQGLQGQDLRHHREDYVVEVTMSPKVKFKDGKATEATVNWGPASAPLLIYPLIYAGRGWTTRSMCSAGGGAASQRLHHQEMCRAQG